MISRNSEGGFFVAHWDWLVAALGLVALLLGGVVFLLAGESDPEASAEASVRRLMSAKKSGTGVQPVVLDEYERALQLAAKPQLLGEVADDAGSFLVSARRIFCHHCAKPIPGNDKKCPLCGGVQPEPEKVTVDTDGDGLPDEWEEKYGLDPKTADADEDKDGDGFTNAEEFAAGTDPSDKDSHPDYFDALQLQLPLKETVLPFYLRSYMKTPGGMKLEFFDPKRRNDYGKNGYRYAVVVGEPIGDTGFVAKSFEQKSTKRKIKGSNVERSVDVSAVTIERKADGKTLVLALDEKRKPVDVQATILFSRGEPRQSTVVPGGALELYGKKYKIVDVKGVGKGAKVTIEDPLGKIRTLEALEQ
ncbi:MAG: RING-HC finger protein [Kiritimatiellae bacterium]|nr:RING-HC finger protein [Kiritimatiellia bacterium]